MKHRIYLAGNITSDVRTFEWRAQFEQIMELSGLYELHDIKVLNPATSEFDQGLLDQSNFKGKNKNKRLKIEQSQNILRPKDFHMVKSSTLMVVNLDIIDPNRPIVGTIQELVWAHDMFYIPVIGIMGNNIYCEHPWILECLSAQVKTVEESIEIIKSFILIK